MARAPMCVSRPCWVTIPQGFRVERPGETGRAVRRHHRSHASHHAKNLFTAQGYRMLKVDKLDNRPISDKILERLKS